MVVLQTLDSVAPCERFDAWTSWNSDAFARVSHRPLAGRELWGTVWDADLGPVGIRGVVAGPHILRRSAKEVAVDDPELVWLTIQLRGRSVITHGGSTWVVQPGDMSLLESSSPFTTLYPEPVDVGVFQIPRRLLRLPDAALKQVVVRLTGATSAGELVVPLLTQIARRLRTDTLPHNREDLGEAVIDLARVVYGSPELSTANTTRRADSLTTASQRSSSSLLATLKDAIDRSLHDPDLTPTSIARAHHISVRYLYRLFEAEGGGVSAWIRRRRLERCRRDLSDPALEHLSVANIGQRWGFRSAAHFSRAFRGVYERSPGDYRRSTQRAAAPEP